MEALRNHTPSRVSPKSRFKKKMIAKMLAAEKILEKKFTNPQAGYDYENFYAPNEVARNH